MTGTEFSIAFSNQSIGTNKLGVGQDGENTWEEMSNHNYEKFVQGVDLGDSVILVCFCQCIDGDTNNCLVELRFELSADACATPALLLARNRISHLLIGSCKCVLI